MTTNKLKAARVVLLRLLHEALPVMIRIGVLLR